METKKLVYVVIVLQVVTFFYLDYMITRNAESLVKNQKIVIENETRILKNQSKIIESITGRPPEIITD